MPFGSSLLQWDDRNQSKRCVLTKQMSKLFCATNLVRANIALLNVRTRISRYADAQCMFVATASNASVKYFSVALEISCLSWEIYALSQYSITSLTYLTEQHQLLRCTQRVEYGLVVRV